jgi:anti-sigma regulatory factor (Ser/Thr protein kinase)
VSSTTSSDPVGIGDADEFGDLRKGTADAHTVAAFRRTFGHWLDQHLELDEERVADIVLATDEAMSNCVDHAYRVVGYAGDITLHVSYYPVTSELKIRVIDHGHWMEPDTAAKNPRGRGILLMRALADDCTIDGGEDGTTVCLRFYGCPPNTFAISQAC